MALAIVLRCWYLFGIWFYWYIFYSLKHIPSHFWFFTVNTIWKFNNHAFDFLIPVTDKIYVQDKATEIESSDSVWKPSSKLMEIILICMLEIQQAKFYFSILSVKYHRYCQMSWRCYLLSLGFIYSWQFNRNLKCITSQEQGEYLWGKVNWML